MIPIEYNTYKSGSGHSFLGGALGLSATFPITENFFLLATLSGLYGSGEGEIYMSGVFAYKAKFNDYGINSNLSIAYYIAPASTTISLGARVQYFEARYRDEKFPITIKNTIYGITLSATYSFDI